MSTDHPNPKPPTADTFTAADARPIRIHPDPEALAAQLRESGSAEVTYVDLDPPREWHIRVNLDTVKEGMRVKEVTVSCNYAESARPDTEDIRFRIRELAELGQAEADHFNRARTPF